MFGAIYAAEGNSPEALIDVAREFSPRIEVYGPREITLDLSGLTRLFGNARTIATELQRTAMERQLRVRIAIAGTRTAARLLARAHNGGTPSPVAHAFTVCVAGSEADALAPLPLALLGALQQEPDENELITTFRRWGLRTCGELACLPADELAARLGQEAILWQRLARGDDLLPLVPAVPEERFEQALDLEWPIDGLEPLSFVLGRLMEPLSAHLDRRGRGAAVLHVRLHLVTRTVHERSLHLPAPMRDARTLRTLALLDLESHPPSAAIDRVVVAVDPTPARTSQFSLLRRPLPPPEQLSTLMARLAALMGEDRCGSPVALDSWQPGGFEMKPFAPRDSNVIHPHGPRRLGDTEKNLKDLRASVPPWRVAAGDVANIPAVALRRFRVAVPARVRVEEGAPVRVTTDRRGLSGGRVQQCAGPWRTSGNWWADDVHPEQKNLNSLRVSVPPWPVVGWDRDEWDVTMTDGATWRIYRERQTDAWFLEGIVD